MASDRGYLEFILEQLAELDGVRARAMMGEYILYYRDRVIGGIYDDRAYLCGLFDAMVDDLPAPRTKKK